MDGMVSRMMLSTIKDIDRAKYMANAEKRRTGTEWRSACSTSKH